MRKDADALFNKQNFTDAKNAYLKVMKLAETIQSQDIINSINVKIKSCDDGLKSPDAVKCPFCGVVLPPSKVKMIKKGFQEPCPKCTRVISKMALEDQ